MREILLSPGWLGVAIGVIGIGIALYVGFRKMGPRLKYQSKGQRLIEGGGGLLPSEVVVTYEGVPVPQVSLAQIIIWNSGQAAVRGEDIASDHPISFDFGLDAEILKAEIAKFTREPNNSAVSVEDKRRNVLRYHFSFLDRRDGALIRIWHTGATSKPACSCAIINMPKGLEYLGRIPDSYPSRIKYLIMTSLLFIWGIIGIAMFLESAFPGIIDIIFFYSRQNNQNENLYIDQAKYNIIGRIFAGLFGLLFSITAFSGIWTERRRFPFSLIPEELTDNQEAVENDKPSS